MLYVAEVAVCSEINTKHINTVWAECTIVKSHVTSRPEKVNITRPLCVVSKFLPSLRF